VPYTLAVREFLKYLKEQGKTVVLSTHLMNEAELVADRVVIIHQGEKVEEGKIADIFSRHQTTNLEQAFLKVIKVV
jgi:sodium transport system ATP-binding protein